MRRWGLESGKFESEIIEEIYILGMTIVWHEQGVGGLCGLEDNIIIRSRPIYCRDSVFLNHHALYQE